MKELLSQSPEEILSAGLHPTFDMLETYAYHLPNASLASIHSTFTSTDRLVNEPSTSSIRSYFPIYIMLLYFCRPT